MKFDRVWIQVTSELLINLAAVFFAAIITIPFTGETLILNLILLTGDLLAGSLLITLSVWLRKQLKKRK